MATSLPSLARSWSETLGPTTRSRFRIGPKLESLRGAAESVPTHSAVSSNPSTRTRKSMAAPAQSRENNSERHPKRGTKLDPVCLHVIEMQQRIRTRRTAAPNLSPKAPYLAGVRIQARLHLRFKFGQVWCWLQVGGWQGKCCNA